MLPCNPWQLLQANKKKILACSVLYIILMLVLYSNFFKNKISGTTVKILNYISDSVSDNGESLLDKFGIDLHLEGSDHMHAGMTNKHHHRRNKDGKQAIAIGGGITSKGLSGVNSLNIESKFDMFSTFIPSFCKTISDVDKYTYHFYLAYDNIDGFFSNHSNLAMYKDTFYKVIAKSCPSNTDTGIHFVQCTHFGKPAWAQNDAMMEAYLDDVDFHYRINDDTKFITTGWLQTFLGVLKGYDPALIGVVGPNHAGGNVAILTYDFVHTTHVDIFGFYYPKLFTDWWGDDWMTGVYRPNRMTKLMNVHLAHTLRLGQRYSLNDRQVGNKLGNRIARDKTTLNRYIDYRKNNTNDTLDKSKPQKVVAMSIYGTDAHVLWGAIRNAQLMPLYMPGWRLRIYTPLSRKKIGGNDTAVSPDKRVVPERIISKLLSLGADVYNIPKPLSPRSYIWSIGAIDDDSLSHVLIRNPRFRVSEREATLVEDWMTTKKSLHCIRDHPQFAKSPIPQALWGVDTQKVRSLLNGQSLYELAVKYFADDNFKFEWKPSSAPKGNTSSPSNNPSANDQTIILTKKTGNFLNDVVFAMLERDMMCHDSVSLCERWKHPIRRVQTKRYLNEFVGQRFDSRQDAEKSEPAVIPSSNETQCIPPNTQMQPTAKISVKTTPKP